MHLLPLKKNETSACVKIKKNPCTIVDKGFKYISVVKIIQAMSWRQRGKSSNGHHLHDNNKKLRPRVCAAVDAHGTSGFRNHRVPGCIGSEITGNLLNLREKPPRNHCNFTLTQKCENNIQ